MTVLTEMHCNTWDINSKILMCFIPYLPNLLFTTPCYILINKKICIIASVLNLTSLVKKMKKICVIFSTEQNCLPFLKTSYVL